MKRDADGKYTEPIGSGRDPLNVFTVVNDVDGRPAIRISGEVFGELRTKRSFKDYHLKLQFKWGEKKWPPRDRPDTPRDSGLLYHVHAEPGAEGRTWARSIELQIQEHDVGDLYAVGSAIAVRAKLRAGTTPDAVRLRPCRRVDVLLAEPGLVRPLHQAAGQREADGRVEHRRADRLRRRRDPHRERQGRDAASRPDANRRAVPTPVNSGPIILQSEGAEVFYRDIQLRQITAIPPEFAAKVERVRPPPAQDPHPGFCARRRSAPSPRIV